MKFCSLCKGGYDIGMLKDEISMINESKKDRDIDIRIVVMGDCNTSGIDAAPLENMSYVLEAFLKKQGIVADVYNCGQAMFTTREGIRISQDFKQEVDLLVVNFGLVDAWATTVPWLYVLYYPDHILRKYARKFLKSFKKRLRHPLFQKCFPRRPVVSLEEYADNLRIIIEKFRLHSPNVKIVFWGIAPLVSDQDRDALFLEYDKVTEGLALDCDGVYIDTRSLFTKHGLGSLYFDDDLHINGAGYEIVVQNLYDKAFPL